MHALLAARAPDEATCDATVSYLFLAPRAELPLATVWRAYFDGCPSGSFTVHVHAQAGVVASAAIGAGAADPRVGFAGNLGVELRPLPALGLVVDLQGNFGYQAPVEMVAASLGLRLSDRKRFGFELGATIPITGRERTAVSIDFRFSARLGEVPEEPPAKSPGD